MNGLEKDPGGGEEEEAEEAEETNPAILIRLRLFVEITFSMLTFYDCLPSRHASLER